MSMNIIRHIKVDVYGDVKRYAVAAKQMDMGTRYIAVTLMEDGIEYEIPRDAEVVTAVKRPDGSSVWNDSTRMNNEALVELSREVLLIHGTAKCDIELYQNGNLLSSASFELEIFPSQRNDHNITSSGEYTRLENTIFAAREALQVAQDTNNSIMAAEQLRDAAEKLRVAAEKAREIKENKREENTGKAIDDCMKATQEAIGQTEECLKATDAALKIILDQTGLNGILNAVRDYYERIRQMESDININVDGGTPFTTELLLVDGGTPFTKDYDKYNAGTPYTV